MTVPDEWASFVRLAHRDPAAAGVVLAAAVALLALAGAVAVALAWLAFLGLLSAADAWWSFVLAGGWPRAIAGAVMATLAGLAILTREAP